jgi:glucose-6-phosphate isomerase
MISSFERGEWIAQMWTYSEALGLFGEWWQQLWSESLAKKTTRAGGPAPRVSSPLACLGPRDQHSQVQQLIEGARDKYVFLTRVRTVENGGPSLRPSVFTKMPFHNRNVSLGKIMGAEAQAFEQSLEESGVNYSTLTVESLSERSLGALFMLWQMSIAMTGEVLDIDAFNQPGVELGKKHANQLILK